MAVLRCAAIIEDKKLIGGKSELTPGRVSRLTNSPIMTSGKSTVRQSSIYTVRKKSCKNVLSPTTTSYVRRKAHR